MFDYNPNSGLQRLASWLLFSFMLLLASPRKYSKPSVILVSSMSLWPIANALFYRLLHPSTKIIFETRDIWPLTPVLLGDVSQGNPVVIVMSLLEKLGYKLADRNFSVLPYANRRIKEVTGSEQKNFTWIPNGIEIPVTSLNTNIEAKRVGKRFRIIYAGAIGHANRLDILLESTGFSATDYEIVVFGDGSLKRELMDRFSREPRISFRNKIEKSKVLLELQKADLLYIGWHNSPLYAYGVSANKYNDYMLAQKPILSVGHLEYDPVKQANCGFSIDTDIASELAALIDEISAMSSEELLKLGSNGYKYVRDNNSYERISHLYLEVLHGLA